MLVLVTGGHGFIGSHLCERLLAQGHQVRILARPTADLKNLGSAPVEVVRGDLLDPASIEGAVDGAAWVFHLAGALKGFREADLRRGNVEAAANLAGALTRRGGSLTRLISVSSLAAAGPAPDGETPSTEDQPARPVTWYGRTKLEGEAVLRASGLPLTIIRPPIVFGPRDRDMFQVFQLARRGWAPILAGGDRFYSMVFVLDLVEALIAAAAHPAAAGETFYASGPEVVTGREMSQLIAAAVGRRSRVLPLPESLAVLAGKLADGAARWRGRPEIFSSQKVIEMRQRAWVCSPAKAQRVIGWQAAHPLPEALAQTAAWYRDHGWL